MPLYQTSDIAFAAYLRLNNTPFQGAVRDEINTYRFQFTFIDNDYTLDSLYQKFLTGQLSVEPNSFHQMIRNLAILIKGRS